MLRTWIAVAAIAGTGCSFDPSGNTDDLDVEDTGPDAGADQPDQPSELQGFEAESVPPPADVICIDDDGDNFTIVPECGGQMDCDDGDDETHPSQASWFAQQNLSGNFDYDCDGQEVKKDDDYYSQFTLNCDSGWDTVIPQCGQPSTWMDCDLNYFIVPARCDCNAVNRTQQCR